MFLPKRVQIVEVGPRDGLQNEKTVITTEEKLHFINLLIESGLSTIEVASFVSKKRVPQMADGAEIVQRLEPQGDLNFPVLVPNMTGYEKAIEAGAEYIALISSASETFSLKNSNCTIDEGIARCLDIIDNLKVRSLRMRAYISCSFSCPYEGDISPDRVIAIAEELYKAGCTEIVLSDTIGKSTPDKTEKLIQSVNKTLPLNTLAVHFHDTYGQAMANILTALQLGITTVDSSVAGLGGCPFAKGASGNVATEDLLFMLNGMGIETGIDIEKLLVAGAYICNLLNRNTDSKVAAACDLSLRRAG